MMCETPPPPEAWLVSDDWQQLPAAGALVPVVVRMAARLREVDDECLALAEEALAILKSGVIVVRQPLQAGGGPEEDELG